MKDEKTMVETTLRIYPWLLKALRQAAAEDGMNVAQLIRKALRDFIGRRTQKGSA